MWLSFARSGFLSSREGIPDRKLRKLMFFNFSDFVRNFKDLAKFDFLRQAPVDDRNTGRFSAHRPDFLCAISKFFKALTGHKLFLGKQKDQFFPNLGWFLGSEQ